MKSLDETIAYCDEVAEEQEHKFAYFLESAKSPLMEKEEAKCKECAAEHRQLAEWLKELKARRQVMVNVKEQIKAWKQNDFQNHDYATGFISALSNIEGLIAYSQEQLGVVVCEFEGGES